MTYNAILRTINRSNNAIRRAKLGEILIRKHTARKYCA